MSEKDVFELLAMMVNSRALVAGEGGKAKRIYVLGRQPNGMGAQEMTARTRKKVCQGLAGVELVRLVEAHTSARAVHHT